MQAVSREGSALVLDGEDDRVPVRWMEGVKKEWR